MKTLKLCLALLVAVCLFAGCTNRSNNNTGSSMPEVSTPNLIEDAEEGLEDLGSGIEEGVSDLEDKVEDFLDGSDDERDEDSMLANEEGDYTEDDDEGSLDESVAAAMSTDFSEIGALDAKKYQWGSGGPTDDVGRPNGATLYQEQFGQYDAYFIAPSKQNVYLTFDEGYENGYTPAILDTLKEKDCKAVFFITKDFAQRQPELVTRMVEEGHVLGNHSVKHLSFAEMPLQEAAKDIMDLHDYVKANFGYEMTLFRPPMGEFSEQSLALAQSLGYKSVLWSFAYLDYNLDDQPLTIEAMDTITSKCHPGAIYLLHAVSKTNSEVLGEAIDAIRDLGFTIAKWDIY